MSPTIVITGTSTGIGRATALDLDRRGFVVFATVRREEDGERLRSDASDRLRTLLLDVTDEPSTRRAAAEVDKAVGTQGLDGLVNNAGIARPGPLEFLELDDLRQQLEVNVTGQVAVTQAFLPLLRRATGRIVNVGSIGGRSALPFAGAYCASKFALEALTDALRMELKSDGIEVVLIEPGSVATPIWQKAVETELPDEVVARYGAALDGMKAALGETATEGESPETVARAIHHALTADPPKTRYLVGRMAYARAALQWLPDRWRDALLLRRLTGG